MKLSEIDNCEDCRLKQEDICHGGWTSDGRGEPVEPPCCTMEEDTDLDEWVNEYYDRMLSFEIAEEKRIKREKIKQEKKELAKKRRYEAKCEVYQENLEIKMLRKRINKNNNIMSFAKSFEFAINATNEMFGYKERVETKENPLQSENEKLQQRIDELQLIKKKKLSNLRKRRKAAALSEEK